MLTESQKVDAKTTIQQLRQAEARALEDYRRKKPLALFPSKLNTAIELQRLKELGATNAELCELYGTKNTPTIAEYLRMQAPTQPDQPDQPHTTKCDPDNPWADYVTVEPLPEPNQDIATVTVKRLPTALVPEGGAKWKWVKGYGGNKLPKAVDFQGKLMLVERDGMLKLYPLNAYLTRKRSAYAETPQGPEMVFADAKPGHPLYDMFIDAGVEPKPWGYVEK